MKKAYFFALFCLLTWTVVHAQQPNFCGTPAVKSDWLIRYQQNPHAFPRSFDTLYVPMTIHLLGTDGGAGFFPLTRVLDDVCNLNEDFAPTGIRFYIAGEIDYISNSAYYEHAEFGPGYDMMHEHNVDNTINCYFVADPAGNCGYSIYGLGVALGHNCMAAADNTWAHEMGHAFSLPHTFFGWEGINHSFFQPAPEEVDGVEVERVDGTNCAQAADGFCDTPPDYLHGRWNCNDEGFSTTRQLDPDSIEFRSDATLFMSYSLDACSARFSDEQGAAMRANIINERPNFLFDQTPAYPVPDSIGLTNPANGETILTTTEALLTWEPTPNATHYFVQVSPLPSFGGLIFGGVVEGESLQLSNLEPGRKYFWRMRPFNKVFSCTSFAATRNFRMGAVTATEDLAASVLEVRVFPQPASSSQNIRVAFQSNEDKVLNVRVVNMLGVTVWEKNLAAKAGFNNFEVDAISKAGFYALMIQQKDAGKQEQIVRPLIILD